MFRLNSHSFFFVHSNLKDLDQSYVYNISIGLHQLEKLIGPIRNVHAIGKYSKMCLKILEQLNPNEINEIEFNDVLIDNMLIIDRDVDYISALLSQLNYEGLLDETLGKQFSMYKIICYFFKISLRKLLIQKLEIHREREIQREREVYLLKFKSILV